MSSVGLLQYVLDRDFRKYGVSQFQLCAVPVASFFFFSLECLSILSSSFWVVITEAFIQLPSFFCHK